MVSFRRRWYATPGRQHRLARPVVSVGNLSLGGRGKTPVVALLARMLLEAGERPAILSRGYARRRPEDGVVVVSDGEHLLADVDRAGDEPMMMARAVPGACVLVCDERAMAGALAERLLGATVHLLDDGFQHLQLARDVDIVIVTGSDLRDRPLPFGRLRESPGVLAHADAVVWEGAAATTPDQAGAARPDGHGRAEFSLVRSLGEPIPFMPGAFVDASAKSVVAVAGIARPERFFDALTAAGWSLADTLAFPDHHAYSCSDVARVSAAAAKCGAPVFTTEKDAVRLLAHRPLTFPAAYVPLVVSLEPQHAFREWLLTRVRARAGA